MGVVNQENQGSDILRDLQKLLGYSEWRNFSNAVGKAKMSCKVNKLGVEDHFVDINKTIPMPRR